MSRFFSASRYLAVIPVVCVFLAATALLLFGAASTAQMIFEVIAEVFTSGKIDSKVGKALLLESIELVDLFLLGTVLYVIAIGLYELFIDDTLKLPRWLEIHDLDDLKDKLIGVVIVVFGVLFLGQVISWDGQRDLLSPGVAIALVILSLAYFLSHKKAKGGKPNGEYEG
jgi:uncharacterized membrane protein YqhA